MLEQTKAAYEAFSAGDAAGAMTAIDDDIEWVVRGTSSASGTKRGKEEVGGFWGQLAEKGFTTTTKQVLGDGDTVVVLTDSTLGGETVSTVDVLQFNGDGKLVHHESFGGEQRADRVFG